jgi:ribosomal protein L32
MDVLVLIDKLDDLVHNAKAVPLTDQVRIDREEIYDILDQMRATIPEEIKQAAGSSRSARRCSRRPSAKATGSSAEAREQAVREASQTEIVKLAERQAQEIVEDARRQARETRLEMEDWADSILSTLEVNLDKFLGAVRRGRERLHERSQESVVAGITDEQQRSRASPFRSLRWPEMTVFNIRTVRLQSGEQFRDVKEVELEPLELGGQRYVPIPESPEAALTLTRLSSGLLLELEFDVRLVGPCVRCLGDAGLDVTIRDRQYQATTPNGDEELRTPYLQDDRLDLSALGARPRSPFRLPDQILCRPGLRRPLPDVRPDLNVDSARARDEGGDARWSKLVSCGTSSPVVAIPGPPMAVPKRKTSKSRRDKRRATHKLSTPLVVECPQCHQPKRPHPRLPDLRNVPRS